MGSTRARIPILCASSAVTALKDLARAQQIGAGEVSCQIEIAEAEPLGLAQMRYAFEAAETVALDAPSALHAELAGQRVEDGVDVGRNVQPPPLNVVGGIDDDSQVLGSDREMQSLHEFGAAGPAGENDDHLGSPRIAMIVGGSQQSASEQSAAIDDARDELGIHRQALPKLLPGGFGATLQVQQVRPRCFGIDVVRSQRRNPTPVVDAALQEALVVDFGEVGRRLNIHVAQQEARNGDGAQVVVGIGLGASWPSESQAWRGSSG